MSWFRKNPPPPQETAKKTPSTATIRLKVMRPERFSDAPLVADELLRGRTVVLNLEAVERDDLRHLLDFISGVTYALDGSIKKISGNATFIVTPHSVALADADAAEEALGNVAEGEAATRADAEPAERYDPVAAMFSASDEEEGQ